METIIDSMSYTNKRAFTLIELLAVIAITSILSALLLTGVMQVKNKARSIQCKSNLRQYGIAISSFVTENHALPLFSNSAENKTIYPAHLGSWFVTLFKNAKQLGFGSDSTDRGRGIFLCPRLSKKPFETSSLKNTMWTSYGYNNNGLVEMATGKMRGLGGLGFVKDFGLWKPVPESEIMSPGTMLSVGDGFVSYKNTVMDGSLNIGRMAGEIQLPYENNRIQKRHDGLINNVFCDGHVDSIKFKKQYVSLAEEDLKMWNRDNKGHSEDLK
jgi:prepilin-type N-terminal cleavage/methylation domain-containing protein/prepilin-type processing-associated H-X9-DG protein